MSKLNVIYNVNTGRVVWAGLCAPDPKADVKENTTLSIDVDENNIDEVSKYLTDAKNLWVVNGELVLRSDQGRDEDAAIEEKRKARIELASSDLPMLRAFEELVAWAKTQGATDQDLPYCTQRITEREAIRAKL